MSQKIARATPPSVPQTNSGPVALSATRLQPQVTRNVEIFATGAQQHVPLISSLQAPPAMEGVAHVTDRGSVQANKQAGAYSRHPFMRQQILLCFILLVIFGSRCLRPSAGLAQSFPALTQDRSRGSEAEHCADLTAEPHIVLTKQDGGIDRTEQVLDFTITVVVGNQCPTPVQLQQGSFVSYQTNFPPQVQDVNQPFECLGQQRYLSGLIPPRQKQPFSFRVQGCLFPADHLETPHVTLDTGRLITEKGEKPIPSLTEMAP